MNKILKQILSILLCLLLVACNAQSADSNNADVSTNNENNQDINEEELEEDRIVYATEIRKSNALILGGVLYNVINIDYENRIAEVTRSYLSEDSKTYFSDIDGSYESVYEGSLCQQYMIDYYENLPQEVKDDIIPTTLGEASLGYIQVMWPNMLWLETLKNQYVYPYSITQSYDENGKECLTSWSSVDDDAVALLEGYDVDSMSHDPDAPQFYYWSTYSRGSLHDLNLKDYYGEVSTAGTYYSDEEQKLCPDYQFSSCDVEHYNRPTFRIKLDNIHQSQVVDRPY